ncbi:MAG: DMT family transporter [Bacteroidales bacterium]
MTKEKWIGHLAVLATAILFGLNIPIAKSLMPEWLSPLAASGIRMLFAAIAFWITSLFLPTEPVSKKDLLTLFAASFFGIFMNQTTYIIGLSQTSPIDSSIIATSTPILVMIISFFALREPISMKKTLGVLLGLGGATYLIYYSQSHPTETISTLKGNIYCFIGSILYSVYLVVTRTVSQRYSPVTLMKWMFLFAAIFILPITYKEISYSAEILSHAPAEVYFKLAYVLFGATYLTYILIPVGLKRIRPTTVGMYNYVQPLVASFVAIGIGQDHFSMDKLLVGIVIFYGVYLVTMSKSRADLEQQTGCPATEKIAVGNPLIK